MVAPAAYESPWARVQIGVTAAVHAAACSNSGSLLQWARPGIKPASSQKQHQVLNLLNHSGNSSVSNLKYHLHHQFLKVEFSFFSSFTFFNKIMIFLTMLQVKEKFLLNIFDQLTNNRSPFYLKFFLVLLRYCWIFLSYHSLNLKMHF